jgi:methylated-DNA-[protein]-cysteine S-methyltransferase
MSTLPRTLGFALFDTPIGWCGIAWGDEGVTGVQLPASDAEATRHHMQQRFPGVAEAPPPPPAQSAIDAVTGLLVGRAREPADLRDIVLDMRGVPPFHQRIYAHVRAIPPGSTQTYGEVARALGDPGASRAVGQAMGHNPFAPIVPCHRVLAAGGRSGGFSAPGGARTKLRMLEIEGARFGQPGLFDGMPPAA